MATYPALGTVEAANEQEAIKIAAKEFDIPPECQNRIAVEQMNKSKDWARALMSLRHARTESAWHNFHRKIEMPQLGIA